MNTIKRHWSVILAFLCVWLAPLVLLLVQGIEFFKEGEWQKWKFEVWAMFGLAIILIIYFNKGKKIIENKLFAKEIQGKAKNPFWVLLNGILSIAIFVFLWLFAKTIIAFGISIEKYFFVVLLFESVGQVFYFVHSLTEKNLEVNSK